MLDLNFVAVYTIIIIMHVLHHDLLVLLSIMGLKQCIDWPYDKNQFKWPNNYVIYCLFTHKINSYFLA